MLVRFAAVRAQCLRGIPLLGLFALACSLVVGELPPAEPESGPLAGKGGSAGNSGTESGGKGGSAEPGEGGVPPATAGSVSGSAGMPSAECDADADKHAAEGACGGDDCDDTDADVFPGQTKYFSARQANIGYDYNCDHATEQEQKAAIMCAGVSLSACPTDVGFLGELPTCGGTGRWGTCKKMNGLTCEEAATESDHPMHCH